MEASRLLNDAIEKLRFRLFNDETGSRSQSTAILGGGSDQRNPRETVPRLAPRSTRSTTGCRKNSARGKTSRRDRGDARTGISTSVRNSLKRIENLLDAGEVESISVYVEGRDGCYQNFQTETDVGRHEDAGRLLELPCSASVSAACPKTRQHMTVQHLEAAYLIAQGKLSRKAIAEKLQIGLRTLIEWQHLPEFKAKVKEHLDARHAILLETSIADSRIRLRMIVSVQERIVQAINARAATGKPGGTHEDVPGMDTGMVAVQYKFMRMDDGSTMPIKEAVIDTAVSAELRALAQHVFLEQVDFKHTIKHERALEPTDADTKQLAIFLGKDRLQKLIEEAEAATTVQ